VVIFISHTSYVEGMEAIKPLCLFYFWSIRWKNTNSLTTYQTIPNHFISDVRMPRSCLEYHHDNLKIWRWNDRGHPTIDVENLAFIQSSILLNGSQDTLSRPAIEKNKMSNSTSKNIWIEREMILSPAFHKLNGRAMNVLLLFLYRRQWKQAGRKGKWYTTNNGEIVFSYKEAKKRFKIPKSSFARAIDSLIKYGFIDIAHLGGGLIGDCTRYSISNRWRNYDTERFVQKKRPKDTRGFGFTTKNWEEKTGRKRRKQSKSGIKSNTRTSNKNDTRKRQRRTQLVSDLVQDDLSVNFFIKKGQELFKAVSQSRPQNRYCTITSHTN
jgi:hypothetical protein